MKDIASNILVFKIPSLTRTDWQECKPARMDPMRDDSSTVLLEMNGNTHAENNNMGEKEKFHNMEIEMKEEKPCSQLAKVCTPRIAIIFAILGAAVIISTGTILFLHFKASKPEVPGPTSTTNSSSASSSSTTLSTVVTVSSTKSSSPSSTTSTTTTSSTTTTTSATTTSPTTTTTTLPPCPLQGQFQCSDGRCINRTFVCDGKPHCPNAEDELQSCSCSEDQFRCSSGQCVPSRSRCDGSTQCYDRSDEMNCSNCSGFECDSGLCLWTMSVRCNGKVQCPDLSDEKNCRFLPRHFKCDNGIQVQDTLVCNGVDNCYDNSDEKDCAASDECFNTRQRTCPDRTKCFVHTWMCDGHQDCPGGFDETNCGTCTGDQFQCPDYSCLDKSQICDGRIDCPSGTDEVDCLQLNQNGELSVLNGIITAISHDFKLPVCSDNWLIDIEDDICEYLGNGQSTKSEFVRVAAAGLTGAKDFIMLDSTSKQTVNQSVLARFTKTSECPSQKVVSLTCAPKACGERQVDIITPLVVGGVISPLGKWPWMISLSLLGRDICGGVLIDRRWALTAAHCIITDTADYTLTPHYFDITAGTNSRTRTEQDNAQRVQVDKILIHPKVTKLVNNLLDWDLALLHLSEPVKFGDFIQPVCLPTNADRFPSKSQCYLTGWGYINPDQVTVQDLREAKMTLWLDSECGNINHNSTICAGYHSGQISGCQGDSGGPLMCKNARDKWTVIGIMSSGPDSCNGNAPRQASKFAEVLTSIDWISSSIQKR